MNNVVNFLLDYYVWILVVLGIIIITVIGFLVDSNQKRKKKEADETMNKVPTNEPFPETNIQENIPIVNAQSQSIPNTMTTVTGIDNINQNPVPNTFQNMNPNPNINNNFNQSQFMQQPQEQLVQQNLNMVTPQPIENTGVELALNEQKPHFEPREVPMPTEPQINISNEREVVVPQPVNAIPINQPMPQQFQNIQPAYTEGQNSQMVNTTAIPNSQAIPQPTMGNTIGNVYQQPTAYQNVPNQIPVAPVQQPVGVIPNATVTPNIVTPIQNPQPMNNLEQQVVQSTPTPNIGINFVTDESNIPNTDDDAWKL